MTYFLKRHKTLVPAISTTVLDSLPTNTYMVGQDANGNFLFEEADHISYSGKLYGSIEKKAERVIKTFQDRPSSTGVLLQGEKGAGKTLFAKVLATKALEFDCPVILVNSPYTGDKFNQLMQSVGRPAMVFFDEFEKIYVDMKHQNAVLTLFDGSISSKILNVVTCNNVYGISDFFINRPGRFYYSFVYTTLEEDFIREYCEDNLHNKSEINRIVSYGKTFGNFNFDILKAIVEEMNRYDEPLSEVINYLNAVPVSNKDVYVVVHLKWKSPEFAYKATDKIELNYGSRFNPYADKVGFWLHKSDERPNQENSDEYTYDAADDSDSIGKKYFSLDPSGIVEVRGNRILYNTTDCECVIERVDKVPVGISELFKAL